MCATDMPHHPDCEYYAKGGDISAFDDAGTTHDYAAAHHGMLGMMQGKEHATAAHKGHRHLKHRAKRFFEADKANDRMEPGDVSGLRKHLDDVTANPHKLLDMGASLPSDQAAQLAAQTATSLPYLQGIKPKAAPISPLDPAPRPDGMAEARYNRQLANAQNPMLVLQHAKEGTIQPADLATLNTLYPKLAGAMRERVGEALIEAKAAGKTPSYRQKQGASALLGQPMDSTLTPYAMQAIIASQGPQQAQQKAKGLDKATAPELSAIEKVDKLYQTPQESRLANRKD